MIPEKRTDPQILAQRARTQKRLQGATWLTAAALLGVALLVPVATTLLVVSWLILAAVAVVLIAVQIISLRRLRAHTIAANPPDPLEGRIRKDVDFDQTWRDT